jgi:hypothetical protein
MYHEKHVTDHERQRFEGLLGGRGVEGKGSFVDPHTLQVVRPTGEELALEGDSLASTEEHKDSWRDQSTRILRPGAPIIVLSAVPSVEATAVEATAMGTSAMEEGMSSRKSPIVKSAVGANVPSRSRVRSADRMGCRVPPNLRPLKSLPRLPFIRVELKLLPLPIELELFRFIPG